MSERANERIGIRMEVPYFQVPNDIFKQNLSSSELLVYFYLARCGNQGGVAFPSYADIASNCSVTRSTVIKVIKSLGTKGIIEKQKRYSKNHGEYYSNVYNIRHVFEKGEEQAPPEEQLVQAFEQHAPEAATPESRSEALAMSKDAIAKGQAKNKAAERWG